MGRTRIVRWLRVIFPLVALAILSTLFLLARKPDPDAAIPYAEEQAGEQTLGPGITAPEFSTVTADGSAVTLSASRGVPGKGGATVRDLSLDWQTQGGTGARLTAAAAEQAGTRIALSGDVDMVMTSGGKLSGWRLTAPRIEADTAASRLTAPQAVAVTAPFGTLDAGGMVLSRDAAGRQVLELNRGVRLLYRP